MFTFPESGAHFSRNQGLTAKGECRSGELRIGVELVHQGKRRLAADSVQCGFAGDWTLDLSSSLFRRAGNYSLRIRRPGHGGIAQLVEFYIDGAQD